MLALEERYSKLSVGLGDFEEKEEDMVKTGEEILW